MWNESEWSHNLNHINNIQSSRNLDLRVQPVFYIINRTRGLAISRKSTAPQKKRLTATCNAFTMEFDFTAHKHARPVLGPVVSNRGPLWCCRCNGKITPSLICQPSSYSGLHEGRSRSQLTGCSKRSSDYHRAETQRQPYTLIFTPAGKSETAGG